jgi:hypothetical protein
MLEPAMGCSRIKQIGQGKLVDVPETLERRRIQDTHFSWLQSDEIVDWISDFLLI